MPGYMRTRDDLIPEWNHHMAAETHIPERPSLAVDACYCTSLRKAMRRVSQLYDHLLTPSGLKATQFAILATVNDVPGLSIGDLGDFLDLDRTTTGKNLRPLERAGYLTVARSPNDGRERAVTLTPAGRTTLQQATPLWMEAQRQVVEANGEAFATQLRGDLHRLRAE